MAFIGNDEIRGYNKGSEMFCSACTKDEDLKELKQSEVITNYAVEHAEGTFFCDRCGEEL